MKALFLAGRIAFSGFFIYSGLQHFLKMEKSGAIRTRQKVAGGRSGCDLLALPLMLGGALIALGVKPKLGAAAIVTFVASVSPVMHDF